MRFVCDDDDPKIAQLGSYTPDFALKVTQSISKPGTTYGRFPLLIRCRLHRQAKSTQLTVVVGAEPDLMSARISAELSRFSKHLRRRLCHNGGSIA
jgi:hypothetical protein